MIVGGIAKLDQKGRGTGAPTGKRITSKTAGRFACNWSVRGSLSDCVEADHLSEWRGWPFVLDNYANGDASAVIVIGEGTIGSTRDRTLGW